MKRRELLTSKKAPWNRHFLHHKCQTPVEFDTLDSSFVRASFDYLVGERQQAIRHREPERLGSLKVEHQVELRWLHNW